MGFTAILPTTEFLNEIAVSGSFPNATLLFYGLVTALAVGLWVVGRFTLGMCGPGPRAA